MLNHLSTAQNAAREAGKIILKYYQNDFHIARKSRNDPVTTADYEADRYLRETLLAATPNYGWLSEETKDSAERLSKKRVWVVDPLDGTREFIRGIPEFVVSIGLVENGTPIMGVICNPVTGEMIAGARGIPTLYNNEPVMLTARKNLAEAVIFTSRTEQAHGLWRPYQSYFKGIRGSGSVAYKMALTAIGQVDFFASLRPKNEWDICAGDFLIRNIGGITLTREGSLILYNSPDPFIPHGLLAGPQHLVGEALPIFRF